MDERLTFRYDRQGDILHVDRVQPYAEQESEELEDGVVARLNPRTGDVENWEVLYFSTRLMRETLFHLPHTRGSATAGLNWRPNPEF